MGAYGAEGHLFFAFRPIQDVHRITLAHHNTLFRSPRQAARGAHTAMHGLCGELTVGLGLLRAVLFMANG